MSRDFTAVVSYGTLATATPTSFAWGDAGVLIDAPFTGLHASHVAIGGCVLNDVRREAAKQNIAIDGVRVSVRGGFDAEGAIYGPIEYVLEIDSPAPAAEVADLADFVEVLAEIPRALADSVEVSRVSE